jgi:hypothetical protein
MKYKFAKNLLPGDQVKRISDNTVFKIVSMEIFGQYKKIKFECVNEYEVFITLYNDEVS